jgi:predicted transcriptional regulator
MTLDDVREMLLCEVCGGEHLLDRPVRYGCASDLMSDVLAFSQAGALLLTGLATTQTVQTADIADLSAIILVRGKKPDAAVIAFARDRSMPLLATPFSMYEACGLLYRSGIPSTMKCAVGPGVSDAG